MLDDGHVNAFAGKKGGIVVPKRVRREIWKGGFYDPVNKPRVGAGAVNSGNKWGPGGSWPRFTVAIDFEREVSVGHGDDAGVSVLQSPVVELYHSIRGHDVVLLKVANFLATGTSIEERCNHHDASERKRLMRMFLMELPSLLQPADD